MMPAKLPSGALIRRESCSDHLPEARPSTGRLMNSPLIWPR